MGVVPGFFGLLLLLTGRSRLRTTYSTEVEISPKAVTYRHSLWEIQPWGSAPFGADFRDLRFLERRIESQYGLSGLSGEVL